MVRGSSPCFSLAGETDKKSDKQREHLSDIKNTVPKKSIKGGFETMRNLKKVISSVAALTIVASSASAFAVTFPDVDSSASYAGAVNTLTALNIINGDDNGLFNPDNDVTRAEFTKMAVGALGEIAAAEAQTTSQFNDAANTSVHWAAGYVAQGVADGFINGYDDTTFGPDDKVTFAQACKMLVAAVGYTTYAEAAGGWPSGYVSQASSLGISKGVSANNDVNLTRAQCAILIYNAMQVPLCVIDSWDTTATFAGTVQTPVLKKLDGKEGRDYQTLLTDKHDAYLVKGRVTTNYQGSSGTLEKDEVKYDVEVSDNYDDTLNITKKDVQADQIFKVGETDAANMLFAYTQAIVQKDEDTDEFTILSIENYGNSKTVEFAADDVADDDSNIAKDYAGAKKLPVYKSSTTSSTTKYDLADDVKLYVNGVNTKTTDLNADIDKFILNNATGTVTLVDKTDVGSTSTDGYYDYIMVTYYVDAVVDYTQATSSVNRVYFKAQPTGIQNKLEWDPDDKDIDIKFTKDGNEIAYTDLAENDVISIQYDVANDFDLKDKDFYNVLVSSNVVEGSVSSKDKEDQKITVDGNEYDLVKSMTSTDDYELGTQYQIFIDAFGYVAYYDEGNSEKNYGVIVASYQGNGDDYPTVRLITSDAKVVAYECKDDTEAKKFYNYAVNGDAAGTAAWTSFTKSAISNQIKSGSTVCTYKIVGGKIKFDKAYNGVGGKYEYKANSSKIGSYSISDATTKIIDMDDYMSDKNSGSTVNTLAVSDFEDEAEYTAYFYDKNNDSVYRFAIVFEGTSSIRPETQIAVVKAVNGQRDTDSTTCNAYTVGRAGSEVELLVEDSVAQMSEGAVIAYTTGSEGYVEDGDLYVIYTPASSYDALFANVTANADFAKDLQYVEEVTSGKNAGKKEIAYKTGETSSSKDIFAYLGVVYRKTTSSVELFTKQSSGVSQVADVVDLSLNGANIYTFDYNERASKGVRLSVGNSGTQTNSVFNQAFANDKNEVVWANLDGATPQLAFIKEVDGDVTDAVFFTAP